MAILFTTGTKTSADAATLGDDMASQIRDDLVLHDAWELVEEFTPGGATVRWYVFKCLASESDLPDDFYVVMGRTLSTGKLMFAICEEYNDTTNVMSKVAIEEGNVTYDGDGCDPQTFTLSTSPFAGFGSAQPRTEPWTPGASTIKWWISVSEDGFAIAFNGTPTDFVQVGAYIPLTPLTIDLPIMIIGSHASGTGGITRNPAVAGVDASAGGYDNALSINGGGGGSIGFGPALGFMGTWSYGDALLGDERAMAEQGIVMQTSGDEVERSGYVLGKQKRMLVNSGSMPGSLAWGDSFEMNGTLWVPYKLTDGRIWDTGVPA